MADISKFRKGYGMVSDTLMGFAKSGGKQRGFVDQKYPYTQWVEVVFENDPEPFIDAIKGMNPEQALERARRNWPGATITALDEAMAKSRAPDLFSVLATIGVGAMAGAIAPSRAEAKEPAPAPNPLTMTLTFGADQRLDDAYADRQTLADEDRWQRMLAGEEIAVGTAEENLAAGGKAAEQMAPTPLVAPLASASEAVRDRVQGLLDETPVRRGLDKVFRTFLGATLEEVEQAARTGRLGDKLSLKLLDPAGSLIEQMVKDQATTEGLDPELTEKVAAGAGLMLGMLFPGAGKAKAAKAAAEAGKAAGGAAKEITAAATAAAKQEARVNLLRINASEAVKATIEELNKLNAERLGGHRAVVSHGQTAKAAEGTLTLKAALAEEAETILLDKDKGTALRDLYNSAATHLDAVKRRAAAGDPEAEAKLWPAFAVAAKLAELDEANARNIARALESRAMLSESERAVRRFKPEQLAELARKLEGAAHLDAESLARRLDLLTTPEQQRTFLSQVMIGFRHGRDVFHEAWINALLTNPVTHAANVTGTGLVTLWDLPETAMAGLIHSVFFSGSEGVSRLEAGAKVRGLMEGLGDAFRLAGKTLKTGEDVFGIGKVEITPALSSAAFGWDAATMPGRTLDVLGGAVRMPTRALKAEDAFFKGLNYDMELKALATREAAAEGLTGKALTARVTELEIHPTPEMQAGAIDAALVRTLNADLGPAGQAFMTWANQIPGGRVILPFIRTPTNSAKWFGQRAPVLNLLSTQNWADITAGGAARDKALARIALGNATAAVIAYEVAQGNITGGGSQDKNLRRLQRDPAVGIRPPYSIKVGDTWYSYNRVDPVGNLVGVVADFAELSGQIPDQDSLDEWAAHGEAVALAAGQMMVNKTYMTGLANVLEAIKSPDRSAGRVAAGWARSLVPAGLRQITRQSDDRIIRDARGMVDGFKAGLPYFAQGIPPERNNITGEPITYPPGWGPDMVSPIYITQQGDDPVFKEIIENKISLAPVPRSIGPRPDEAPLLAPESLKKGTRLTAGERDFWIVQMTQEVRDGQGRTLHQHLSDVVGSDQYQRQSRGPDGGRAVLIKAIYQDYRDKAEAILRDPTRGSPNLERDIRARLIERVEGQLPITHPRSPQNPANRPGTLSESLRR